MAIGLGGGGGELIIEEELITKSDVRSPSARAFNFLTASVKQRFLELSYF